MPGVRSKNKGRIEGWIPLTTLDPARKAAAAKGLNDTGLLNEALADWLDRHETTQTAEEQK